MEGAIVITSNGWGCSNISRLKASAKLIGEGESRVIKTSKNIVIDSPFMTSDFIIGDIVTVISRDNVGRFQCQGKVLSLTKDIYSIGELTEFLYTGIDELISNIK